MEARHRCHDMGGGSKSMLWMVLLLLDKRIQPIIVCLYSVLLNEQCKRVQDAGLKAANFRVSKDPPKDMQILFVQVEHVSQKSVFLFSKPPNHAC